ncbi:MAG: DNA polymerase III subunit delta' [Phycisphaerae bacterium]
MFFREVHHQDRAQRLLAAALRSKRFPHALLFHGPEGVGKELTATALAARLQCERSEPDDLEPCGECNSCRVFAKGSHPDFHLIHRGLRHFHPDRTIRASKGLFLVVDLIRHFLIEPAGKKPMVGARRVFVIRDAERMNEEAQNAILKTLEEPPPLTTLILVTSSADRLLQTIRSRCAPIAFGLLPRTFLHERLVAQGQLPDTDARALAELADGRLGTALHWHACGLLELLPRVFKLPQYAASPEAFGKEALDISESLARMMESTVGEADTADEDSASKKRSASASKAIGTDVLRDALKVVLSLVAMQLRAEMLAAVGAGETSALATGMRTGGDEIGLADQLDLTQRYAAMLDRNVAPQLVCEALAVQLATGH